jgi:hydroxyethylthiazole kinase-like uncharacterized protein yjeF
MNSDAMQYLSTEAMREADRRCIEDLGIPGAVLMNNAGSAVFREIAEGPAGVVCGKGNNGGDGYVVARLAMLAGMETRVLLLADPEEISGDAATFLNVYRRLGGAVRTATEPEAVRREMAALSDCKVLVDAMLGTGVNGEVRDPFKTAIENWPPARTIAVDLPSGLNADTGEIGGCAVRADVTVTFQFAMTGFRAETAQAYLGRLEVADIGIPAVCADDQAWADLGL